MSQEDSTGDSSDPSPLETDRDPGGGGPLARLRKSYLLRFAAALVVAVAIIGAAGFAVQAQTTTQLQSDVESQLEQEARSEAQQLSSGIGRSDSQVVIAADNTALAGDQETRQAYAERLLETQLPESAQSVHVVNTVTKEVVASTDQNRVGDSSTESPWGGTGVDVGVTRRTDPFTGPDGDRVLAVTTISPRDLQMMLVVEFSAERQSEQFSSGVDGTFTEIVKPTSDGTEVVFSNYPGGDTTGESYVPNATADEIPELANADANGTYVDSPTKQSALDQEYVAASATVAGTDWIAIKHAPRANTFALSQSVGEGILLLVGLALVGVSAIGATIGRTTAGSLRDLSQKATAIEGGDYDVELDSQRRDEIGRLYASIDAMRDTLVTRLQEAEEAEERATDALEEAKAARADAEEAQQKAEQINQRLVERAEQFSAVMADCADGDLTRRMATDSEVSAMQSIAESFNQMVSQWEETLISIRDFADGVDTLSENAAYSVNEIRSASEQVSQSAQTITDTVKQQDQRAQTASKETADLSATVEEITSTTEAVAKTAEQTADRGTNGQEAAKAALEELDAIEEQTTVAVETVNQLSERMGEIEEVVDFITDIAEQTNTLALNANIEAARANEDGDGFSVVAQEVKSLAEETKEATEEIGDLVDDIHNQTEATVDDMDGVSDRVDEGTVTVEEALQALDEIAGQARETSDGTREIRNATKEQASAAQSVAQLTDELSDLTRDAADEAENVAASTEEQTASVNDLSQQVSELSDRAGELNNRLERFSVGASSVGGPTPTGPDGSDDAFVPETDDKAPHEDNPDR